MNYYWFGKTRSPIGIDVGHRCVKAVQLRGSPGQWTIYRAHFEPRTHPDQPFTARDVGHLHLALNGQGFSGRDVVLAVPDEYLLAGNLELPPRKSKAPLEQIARMELARIHQHDPQDLELACWDLPTGGRASESTHVMAMACPTTEANTLLETFESEGFHVRALDVQACALARACRSKLGKVPLGMILDVGWAATRLVVLYQGVVVYERLLREGGIRHLVQLLSEQLHLKPKAAETLIREVGLADEDPPGDAESVQDPPPRALPSQITPPHAEDAQRLAMEYFDAVAEELRLSFAYTVHRYRKSAVNHLLLVGGGAGISGLGAFFKRVLELNITRVCGTDLAKDQSESDAVGSEAIVAAMGLAQHSQW